MVNVPASMVSTSGGRLFRMTVGATEWWRRFLLLPLVLLPFLLVLGAGSARASCTYDVGSNPALQSVQFRSTPAVIYGGYAGDIGPGQSQCWYGHGWDGGWFAPENWGWDVSGWPDGINVDAHGWIDICVYGGTNLTSWAYQVYAANGAAGPVHWGGFQSNPQYPPGCRAPLGSSGASSTPSKGTTEPAGTRPSSSSREVVFFTSRASSRATRSITFHLYGGHGKPLASVCMSPVDVSHLNLALAKRMGVKFVYIGVTEHARSCADLSVANRELAGRPLPDVHYARFCAATNPSGVTLYRYPADFGARTPPTCPHR